MIAVRLQAEPFDPAAETAALTDGRADVGGVVSFLGLCRDEGGRLSALELEHYPGMAEAEIGRIAEAAAARWPVLGIRVVHRYGVIPVGEPIVLVAVSAPHRGGAFAAAEFLMDFLKTQAPFWKREHPRRGPPGAWVAATDADDAAAARWRDV